MNNKELTTELLENEVQVLYNQEGQPLYALVPLKPPLKKRSVDEILKESAAEAKRQGITLKDLLSELKKVRRERYKKYYA
jgi:hypothetical protein